MPAGKKKLKAAERKEITTCTCILAVEKIFIGMKVRGKKACVMIVVMCGMMEMYVKCDCQPLSCHTANTKTKAFTDL